MSVEETKQGREAPDKYGWVETSIWTERMLTALERGLEGGKWFSLIDKVYSGKNLQASWIKVKGNRGSAGVDAQSIERFSQNEQKYLDEIQEELKGGKYRPQPVRRVWIPKEGSSELRPLGIPVVKDRIVQTAIRNVIEPIFEKKFYGHSYGFRPRKSCKDALRRVTKLLKEGYRWIVDIDIRDYFGNIEHRILMKKLEEEIADRRLLELIGEYLKAEIVEESRSWTAETGTPQGGAISPLLSNIYLHSMDMELSVKGYELIRYADDFVVLCREKEEAGKAAEETERILKDLKLEIHRGKSGIIDMEEPGGFDFLGYHFERSRHMKDKINRYPTRKSLKKIKDKVRGITKRRNGNSLEFTTKRLNLILKGWFEYYKHSHRWIFISIDSWIRMRLRSILRRRHGRRGRGRGLDHVRYPNAYFADIGLFSLKAAYTTAVQP